MNRPSTEVDDLVQVRLDGAVAIMTLNAPVARNAFSIGMREHMFTQLRALHEREECRVLVLTGAGDTFCSGGDIREMRRRGPLEARNRMELPTRLFKMLVA